MSQSKRHSAIETATNTSVGFIGSYFITFACFHIPGVDLATKTLYATLGCTAWSLLRGYYLRRLFNHIHINRAAADAGMEVRVHADTPSAYLQVVSGAQLDRIGSELYQVYRQPTECDSAYRNRVWAAAVEHQQKLTYADFEEDR